MCLMNLRGLYMTIRHLAMLASFPCLAVRPSCDCTIGRKHVYEKTCQVIYTVDTALSTPARPQCRILSALLSALQFQCNS